MDEQTAGVGPVDGSVRPVSVAHGSDEHLTLLGAPWHWNLLHGVDRADMLGFGRACMEAGRMEGVRSVQEQTAVIVRASLELLEAIEGETPFTAEAARAFKRVFGA